MQKEGQWILKESLRTGGKPKECTLSPGQRIVAGRSRRSDFRFLAPTVSRKHCLFEVSPDGALFLSDLGATIPTQVNNVKLSAGASCEVNSGDSIVLGDAVYLTAWNLAEAEPKEDESRTIVDRAVSNTIILPPAEGDAPQKKDIPSPSGTVVFSGNKPEEKKISQGSERFENTIYFHGKQGDSDGAGVGNVPFDQTIVINDDDLLGRIEKSSTDGDNRASSGTVRKSGEKRTRLILGCVLLLSCGLLLIPSGEKKARSASSAVRQYEGSYFSCSLPSKWVVSAKGEAIVLSARNDLCAGVALLKIESPDVKHWTFETHAERLIKQTLSELFDPEDFQDISLLTSGDKELPSTILHQNSLQQIPFVMARLDRKGFGEARVYLNRDVAVGVVAWGSSSRSESEIQRVLESFSLEFPDAHVDRRLWANDLEKKDVRLKIETAEGWLAKAHIAPGNAWKAYVQLLQVRSWFAMHRCPPEFREYDTRSYNLSCEVAENLNQLFVDKQRQALRALRSGQRQIYLQRLASLQQEFPSRKDLRWIWAEKSKVNGVNQKKSRLF